MAKNSVDFSNEDDKPLKGKPLSILQFKLLVGYYKRVTYETLYKNPTDYFFDLVQKKGKDQVDGHHNSSIDR